jgi:hypothetical protein
LDSAIGDVAMSDDPIGAPIRLTNWPETRVRRVVELLVALG